ncbi:hypothetical protein EDD52_102468 [Primorskyibacter sedentarius]|uniref:Secreted protein with PEP-CTERM sorting signal n=1 Tax=Primorskyibacter sedentarius TaxID=745311 RepID=A0A4R3JM28_9RHOB|nr:hypothetical protein [Primorskyibacter sedentarius]TCS66650.1 hypothetical protein EDD52_102468 [Primorskyibacter sedentarius]
MRPLFLILWLIASIFAANLAVAATYKISVKTSLEQFSLNLIRYDEEDYPYRVRYDVRSSDDPVLENYPYQHYIDAAFSGYGSMQLSDRIGASGSTYWTASNCTGVFVKGFCQSNYFLGQVTGSSINLLDGGYYHHSLSTESGIIKTATDSSYDWSNSLGNFTVLFGENIVNRIDAISISQVPVPASGLLLLMAVFGTCCARVTAKKKNECLRS